MKEKQSKCETVVGVACVTSYRCHRVRSLYERNWGCVGQEVEIKFEFSAGLVITKGDLQV